MASNSWNGNASTPARAQPVGRPLHVCPLADQPGVGHEQRAPEPQLGRQLAEAVQAAGAEDDARAQADIEGGGGVESAAHRAQAQPCRRRNASTSRAATAWPMAFQWLSKS